MRLKIFPTALVFLAASGLVLAQDQPPANPQSAPPMGGWRRAGDPPPNPEQGDPSTPVDRSDAYGQPAQAAPQDAAPPPQAAQPPRYSPRPGNRQAYGLPRELTLQPGTYVTIRTNQPLSSDHNQPGDTFSGTLMQSVVVDGVVVAQRGQTVYGRVAEVQRQHSDKNSRLGLELTGLTLADGTQAPIRSQLVARQGGTTPAGAQAGTVAATTGIGAMVGAAADWGRGAAIGAGVGAAAGIIGVLATRNHPTVVYPETPLTFRVDSPVAISTLRAPQAFRYVGPDEYDRPVNTQLQPRPAQPRPYAYGPNPYGYGYGYGYGYPYYPYYGGPGVSFGWGSGYFYGYGRGFGRRWR